MGQPNPWTTLLYRPAHSPGTDLEKVGEHIVPNLLLTYH